jgi:hypothetical protein
MKRSQYGTYLITPLALFPVEGDGTQQLCAVIIVDWNICLFMEVTPLRLLSVTPTYGAREFAMGWIKKNGL